MKRLNFIPKQTILSAARFFVSPGGPRGPAAAPKPTTEQQQQEMPKKKTKSTSFNDFKPKYSSTPRDWKDLVSRRDVSYGDVALGDAPEVYANIAGDHELFSSKRQLMGEKFSERISALSKDLKSESEKRFFEIRELYIDGELSGGVGKEGGCDPVVFQKAMDTLFEIRNNIPEAVGFMGVLTAENIGLQPALEFLADILHGELSMEQQHELATAASQEGDVGSVEEHQVVAHIAYNDTLAAFTELALNSRSEVGEQILAGFINRELFSHLVPGKDGAKPVSEPRPSQAWRIFEIIADNFVDNIIRTCDRDGQGAAMKMIVETFAHLSRILGEISTKNICIQTFNIVGELLQEVDLHITAGKVQGGQDSANRMLSPIIAFHKAFIHMKVLGKMDPRLEFRSMYHLFNALVFSKKLTESHRIGEKIIDYFEKNRRVLLQEDEDRYRLTMYRMCEDKVGLKRENGRNFLHRVIEKIPNASVPWRFLALDLLFQKRHEDALIAIRKAISLNPIDDYSILVLVQIYDELKRPALRDEAMELARRASDMKDRVRSAAGQDEDLGIDAYANGGLTASGDSEDGSQLRHELVQQEMERDGIKKHIETLAAAESSLDVEYQKAMEDQREWREHLEKMRAHHIYGLTHKQEPRLRPIPINDRVFEYSEDAHQIMGAQGSTDAFLATDPVLEEGGTFVRNETKGSKRPG